MWLATQIHQKIPLFSPQGLEKGNWLTQQIFHEQLNVMATRPFQDIQIEYEKETEDGLFGN